MTDTQERNGPGTVGARFAYLLDELEARFPAAVNKFDSTVTPETRYLAVIDTLKALLSSRDNAPDPVTFSVDVVTMKESCGITYHVLINRSDRPKNESPMSDVGRMNVFYSENREHADMEAADWRAFIIDVVARPRSVAVEKEKSGDSADLEEIREAVRRIYISTDVGGLTYKEALTGIERILDSTRNTGVVKSPALELESTLREQLLEVIRDYYYALDIRANGSVASGMALSAVERILGTHWVQGAEQARRAK